MSDKPDDDRPDAAAPARSTYVQTEPPLGQGPAGAEGEEVVHIRSMPAAPRAHTTAIIAWHGMGQQLPFETVGTVATALAKREARLSGGPEPTVTTRYVKLGDERLRRAELSLDGPGGRRDVHVYEAYWAPLSEGRITLAETTRFLLGAGLQGVRYGLWPPRLLERYLFGRWVAFPLQTRLALVYLTLLATLLALIVVNTAVTLTLAIKIVTGPGDRFAWPSYALFQDLTLDLACLAVPMLIVAVVLGLTYRADTKRSSEGTTLPPQPLLAAAIWILIAVTLIVALAVGALIVFHLLAHGIFGGTSWPWPALVPAMGDGAPLSPGWQRTVVITGVVVWGIVLAGSAAMRWFLLEFVGDTAIYVSSHKLNRFYEAREAIKSRSCAVAGAVYRHGGYDNHILIGHSLGSVVAYDTLNTLILDDQLATGGNTVTPRTGLLLTFGSILDKTAFLFRVQSDLGEVREALASATQPLISDPPARPLWINIHSSQDVFSGALDYYDPTHGESGAARSAPEPPAPIVNRKDSHAWIPVLAHQQYWYSELLLRTLSDAIRS